MISRQQPDRTSLRLRLHAMPQNRLRALAAPALLGKRALCSYPATFLEFISSPMKRALRSQVALLLARSGSMEAGARKAAAGATAIARTRRRSMCGEGVRKG